MKLHKEHGLNPTISICFFCGEEKNEIGLLGASYKGEAPLKTVLNLEPCMACENNYTSKGVFLLESLDSKNFTGRFVCITDESFKKIFNIDIPEKKIAFVEPKVFINFIEKEGE